MTPKQTLIMWCLIGKQGYAFQGDIVPKVGRKDREALIAAGYISSSKRGQKFLLNVEDKGWHWAGEHLRDEIPRGFQVLQNWLERLHHHLKRNNETLAEFIGPAPELPPEPAKAKRQRAQKGVARQKKSPTAQELRRRIEEAYLAVTNGRKAESAPLSKVRARLADLDRATVDAALLRILQGDEKARLGQISDPTALSQEERSSLSVPAANPSTCSGFSHDRRTGSIACRRLQLGALTRQHLERCRAGRHRPE